MALGQLHSRCLSIFSSCWSCASAFNLTQVDEIISSNVSIGAYLKGEGFPVYSQRGTILKQVRIRGQIEFNTGALSFHFLLHWLNIQNAVIGAATYKIIGFVSSTCCSRINSTSKHINSNRLVELLIDGQHIVSNRISRLCARIVSPRSASCSACIGESQCCVALFHLIKCLVNSRILYSASTIRRFGRINPNTIIVNLIYKFLAGPYLLVVIIREINSDLSLFAIDTKLDGSLRVCDITQIHLAIRQVDSELTALLLLARGVDMKLCFGGISLVRETC